MEFSAAATIPYCDQSKLFRSFISEFVSPISNKGTLPGPYQESLKMGKIQIKILYKVK